MKSICIVTSLHLSYNPRVLKEADALHEAGYDVRVVAMQEESDKAEWDARLMSSRSWTLQTLNARRDNIAGSIRWFLSALRQKLYRTFGHLLRGRNRMEISFSRHFPEMYRLAAHKPAHLFIAHNLQALPVAAFAARKWKARLGFDAEDFHRGEISDADIARSVERQLIAGIEKKYIPRCDYLSAASDGIGDAYVSALGVPKPATILNTFPLSERQGHTPPEELKRERRGPGLSLYWYSQVIGSDRGLEDAINALAILGSGVHLHIRGTWARGYEEIFQKKIKELGIADCVHVVPPAPPEQLVERATEHDVGLALEPGNTANRQVAVTNKILNYFLAGLAIAATDLPGHRQIMQDTSGAGFLFPAGNAHALADGLQKWRDYPQELSAAKVRSRTLGSSRFCWEPEKRKLIGEIAKILQ